MTTLQKQLARFLPPALTRVTLVAIYAALLIMIVMFLITPAQFEMVYLDVGK